MRYLISERQYKHIIEQFESKDLLKYWNQIEKVAGEKITDEDFNNEEEISGGIKMENGGYDSTALKAFESLKKDCPGLQMDEDSYRTFQKQTDFFIETLKKYGSIKKAMSYRALPGFSQHHTGKAFDIEKPDSVRACAAKNASKHGFIFPYKGNGVRMAEPWHLYYKG